VVAAVTETPYVSVKEAVMGKHEIIKPSSTARVAKHRAEMRAKGYKLKQRWVIDINDPAVRLRIREECTAIAEWERRNPDEVAWMEELTARAWNDLPDYDWK
jgi:Protein  of unknown function (DUF3018)